MPDPLKPVMIMSCGVIAVLEERAGGERGKSLLPPGIARCEGEFKAGEVVRICGANGTEFARGIADYSAEAIKSGELARVEVVHRDNLVIL